MTRNTRIALLGIAVVIIVVAVIVIGGGGSAHSKISAKIDVKFIVELEDHGVTLANVTVEP